jgi:hypothetical protein
LEYVVDVTSGAEVNDAYAIETTYDSTTDTYHVTAQATTGITKVLPVHPNRGDWTNEQLTTYINEVLGLEQGGSVPPIQDFVDVDKCSVDRNPLPSIDIVFSGSYARYDMSTDSFVSSRNQSFLRDLVAGPNGTVDIDLSGYEDDLTLLNTFNCSQKVANKVEGDQCSRVESFDTGSDGPCSNLHDRFPESRTQFTTQLYPLEYYKNASWVEIFIGTGASRTVPATMFIRNYYFDKGGNELSTHHKIRKGVDGMSLSKTTSEFGVISGVCGHGDAGAELDGYYREVNLTTAAGDHPNPCPNNPF